MTVLICGTFTTAFAIEWRLKVKNIIPILTWLAALVLMYGYHPNPRITKQLGVPFHPTHWLTDLIKDDTCGGNMNLFIGLSCFIPMFMVVGIVIFKEI